MNHLCLHRLVHVLCAALLLVLLNPVRAAEGPSAGYERVKVPDGSEPSLDVALWFPTDAAASALDFGPFTLQVARGGAVLGKGLPLVVVSHGNGGSAFSHHDTAEALARAGFVVAAVTHTGDNYADQSREVSMMDRPRHLSRVIDHLLTNWRGSKQLDPARVGVFGFSSGGFTALAIAGGVADLRRVGPHCTEHPTHYACQVIGRRPKEAAGVAKAEPQVARDPRVRAAVVVAPALGFTFTRESLAALAVPLQLWRAEDDEVLPHPWYAGAVRSGLTGPVDYREVPKAGHFDFLAPCTERFAAMAPPLCSSLPGFDREAFHLGFNAAVVSFFQRSL